jgi:hypothetical protein
MCRPRGPGWCGQRGCTRPPRVRPWRSAAPRWGKSRWSSHHGWLGRRRAKSVEQTIPSAVPCVGGGSSAVASSYLSADPLRDRGLGRWWQDPRARHAPKAGGGSGLSCHHTPRGPGTRRAAPQGGSPPGARPSTRSRRDAASLDALVRGASVGINSIGSSPRGARAVHPGVEADRGALGGAAVELTRARLTPNSLGVKRAESEWGPL